ncbi:MAG: hypothetical protein ACRDGQ_05935 [Candidatus Limnocylindrales bacterium]
MNYERLIGHLERLRRPPLDELSTTGWNECLDSALRCIRIEGNLDDVAELNEMANRIAGYEEWQEAELAMAWGR